MHCMCYIAMCYINDIIGKWEEYKSLFVKPMMLKFQCYHWYLHIGHLTHIISTLVLNLDFSWNFAVSEVITNLSS